MRTLTLFGLTLAATVGAMASGTAYAGDAAAGERAFKKYCSACHSVVAGQNRVGPSLHGVVGRASGAVVGFTYSRVLKALNITWTEDNLNQWMEGPAKMAPGTKAAFVGVKDLAQRADLIAYLVAQK